MMRASWLEIFFIAYFVTINAIYTAFLVLGSFSIFNRKKEINVENPSLILTSNSLPEILFIFPMYNESSNALSTIFNILQLTYRYKKIIAVNDGSTDDTLMVLQKGLKLLPIPKYYQDTLPTKTVKAVYRSKTHPNVIVIDKEWGHKYDALNAAINAADTPFFIINDADTLLDNTSFEAFVRPFLTEPQTVAVGASIRIRNDCTIDYNRIKTVNFPQNVLPAFQSLEYLRSFLLRQGFDLFNGNMIVAGAFSIFPRDLTIKAGGFAPSSEGEDVEMIVRLHHLMRLRKKKYSIKYFPDPVAWTLAPSKLKVLGRQRTRWHYSILEALWFHKTAFFNPKYGSFGVVSLPLLFFGEGIEPVVETAAWVYILIHLALGTLSIYFLLLVLAVSFGYTFLYTIYCLFIEEWSFRKYPSLRSLTVLLFSNLIENFGYRQLTVYWRLRAFLVFFKNRKSIRVRSKYISELMKKVKNQI